MMSGYLSDFTQEMGGMKLAQNGHYKAAVNPITRAGRKRDVEFLAVEHPVLSLPL